MANDIPSNASPNLAQADMDDILSSIRSGVAEEGSKVGNGSADLIDAAAADSEADDDVLELNEADMVAGEGSSDSEELIDLDAFGASGEAKTVTAATGAAIAEELLQGAQTPAVVDAADEFDRLLAEISQEQQQQVVASKISKDELMAEMAAEEQLEATSNVSDRVDESATASVEDIAEDVAIDEGVEEVPSLPVPQVPVSGRYDVGAIEGPNGVQLAFPAEVLAMALRPMVQEWLAKNLPEVVEKLVKEEISKLSQS